MFIKRMLSMAASILLVSSTVWASTATDIEKAAHKGQVAFVLITDGKAADVSTAKNTIQDAVKQYPKSVLIELDRNKPENAELIAKYKLSTIPVPIVIALNPNGVISGAIQTTNLTSEMLLKVIPSPKKAEVMKALSEGNSVFVTAYRKNMASVETVNNTCAMACQKLAGKSVHVKVDMDDPAEAKFLAEMKINTASTEPVTVVANQQGQIAGTFNGDVQVTQLVTTATKKIGGCCPKTVSKPDASCGPTTKQ